MEYILKLAEERSSQHQPEVSIDHKKLKFFISKVKICEYARLNYEEYQKLSVEHTSLLLQELVFTSARVCCSRYAFFVFIVMKFLICFLGESNFELGVPSGMKSADLVSMTKSATESDKNLTTEIVAARFEKDIGSVEVSGEKRWRSFGFFDSCRSD